MWVIVGYTVADVVDVAVVVAVADVVVVVAVAVVCSGVRLSPILTIQWSQYQFIYNTSSNSEFVNLGPTKSLVWSKLQQNYNFVVCYFSSKYQFVNLS